MDSVFTNIDMTDPCAVFPKLQEVYYRLLAGENVVRSKFGEEEVQFSGVDIKELKRTIENLKAQCRAKGSSRSQHRAIRCGWR